MGGAHFGSTGGAPGTGSAVLVLLPSIRYYIVDTHACPVDVAFLDGWLSVLACGRLAGAYFSAQSTQFGPSAPADSASPLRFTDRGGALWLGAEARLRVQAPFGLFVEAGLGANYGTVSAGESTEPAWVEASAGAGLRL
jgi:hypothetical protein